MIKYFFIYIQNEIENVLVISLWGVNFYYQRHHLLFLESIWHHILWLNGTGALCWTHTGQQSLNGIRVIPEFLHCFSIWHSLFIKYSKHMAVFFDEIKLTWDKEKNSSASSATNKLPGFRQATWIYGIPLCLTE